MADLARRRPPGLRWDIPTYMVWHQINVDLYDHSFQTIWINVTFLTFRIDLTTYDLWTYAIILKIFDQRHGVDVYPT